VSFTLSAPDLAFSGPDLRVAPEAGMFDVYVGGDSRADASAEFELVSD
jgi:hypothetical protein